MKNRTLLKILLILTAFVLFSCSNEPMLILQGSTMGTWYTVKVSGAETDHDRERIQMAIDIALTKINLSVNTFNPKSEISKFNGYKEPGAYPLSQDFMKVARVAKYIYEKSNGAFDPSVKELVQLWGFGDSRIEKKPDLKELDNALSHVGMNKIRFIENGLLKKDPDLQLDFSAIAKGFGVDLVLDEIELLGYENILVEIGGEVRTKGNRDGKSWHIGIAVPDANNVGNKQTAEAISLKDMACATSGDYQQFYLDEGERYTHLIDPKTGYPIKHEVTSVTVVAKSCMLADAAATAAIVLGKTQGLAFIESLEGVEAFFIYREGDVLKSTHSSEWLKATK